LGLLAPVHVDASSGYRYYARAQIRDAMAIGLLRSLDVSLPTIAEVLAGDEATRASVLTSERDRLEGLIARQRRTVQALERLLADGLLAQEVSLVREPLRQLVVAETVGTAEDIGTAIGHCVQRVLASGVPVTGPLFGLFPTDLDGPLRIAVGIEGVTAWPGLEVRRLPASVSAVTTHAGPYEHLPLAYQAVFAWIHERGLSPRGTVHEVYLSAPPDEPVTRLVVPVDEELG